MDVNALLRVRRFCSYLRTNPRNENLELTSAWKSLAQSKAALRHIENRLEAAPGTGVFLDSVMDPPKKKSSKMVRCRDGQQADDSGGSSKRRGHSQQSPEKSSSRSPLRNATQDSNVRRNNNVDFKEPLASYSLQSVPGSLYPSSPPSSDPLLSRLVYQRDTRDRQADRDMDSTRSSALESTEVRYLNDQPALGTLRTIGNQSPLTGVGALTREGPVEDGSPKAQLGMDSQATTPCVAPAPRPGESTPSTSPGSASQRLENLRRHQPDDKLEKLKERIRRQRQHLEEAAEKEKLLGNMEQPIIAAVGSNNAGTSNIPTAKIRKIAAAPPAPIYKGFNSTETKIRTPDGKVWKEDEFHNLSREIYRDLSRQFAGKEERRDRSKERRPPKPVRKVHRAVPASDLNVKPGSHFFCFSAVISPASWREGQKLVKMVLGPVPKLQREEDRPHPADRLGRTASHHHSSSDPRSESNQQSHPKSTERPHGGFQGESKSHSTATSTHSSAAQDNTPVGISRDLLSADIQGILDDLQLECHSSRSCRSASPAARRPETANIVDTEHKKRHYDADTVRQYIARQQEERRRRQAEEKRALREEAERRNQRLQELYRKQREVAKTVTFPNEAPVAPVQKRLQETYNKLLLEEAQLGNYAVQTQPARPMYQPSGESDKENKRLEAPQSPSSSDRSLNDQPPPPPLSRNDLDVGVASLLQPDHLSPSLQPTSGPSSTVLAPFGDQFLTQMFRVETGAVATGDIRHTQQPATAPSDRSHSKISRIEALKAKAASLSNRIESEARKLVGEGINYGTATSVDRILTSTGHSSFNGTPLPGAGSLHTLTGQKEKKGTHLNLTNIQATSNLIGPVLNSYTQAGGKLVNGLEDVETMDKMAPKRGYDKVEAQTDLHDSSAGSISEGPILSEGSFSEDEANPPYPSNNHISRAAERLEAVDYCASQRTGYQHLTEFQREAAKCSALSSPFSQQDNVKAAWEELNKGSPLSVISIFTKNLHGHVKGYERNSPSAYSLHSGNDPGDAAHYEDDFVSSHSSRTSSELQYSPAVLQQRMSAELQYLESIEESVQQLDNMEKLMGVSMAQQESVSLAQMLKAKQQQHERDLCELKIKAEREALETKLQLEENRQRVENLVVNQKQTLENLQEATTKMMSQQAEAAQYTADAARHIKEVSNHCLHHCLENSPSDSSSHPSLSHVSSDHSEQVKKEAQEGKWRKKGAEGREAGSTSIEDEVATAANDSLCSDSIPSVIDEKDSTSVATEYSFKFDESMTEDEIEEQSFRSLLPSEAHRRGTMEKKSRHHEESEDDGANHNTRLDVNMAFSGGQDSFSQFTMDMVRQYMRDEEVRLQHQSALLRLRQKALKEKARTELAWLEHQKKRLRDKGEDDKMPPIRKKQRGLLLKLQQEQAEIKRLQEANKAAMKERQLLLKQQEEIERMRNSTLRLKERLKCAGGEMPLVSSAVTNCLHTSPSMRHANENRSPSPPLSVSGSETSSIMQKLKKMHSHTNEKFLTKREQQLMQRRRHAEELLQWKRRLDQEEAEVRRMEKEALAVWDRQTPQDKSHDVSESQKKEISDISSSLSHPQSSEQGTDNEKEYVSEGGCSSATPESSIHTEELGSQQAGSPSSVQPLSVPETPLVSIQSSYTQDFTLVWHWFHILTVTEHLNLSSEPISDQSDIESRIKALKEELRKRKFMAYQLKKEQKKRHKERLKAQEASLLKQLETYNNIIEKTKAELSKEPDSTPATKSQIRDSTSTAEQFSIKPPIHRYPKHLVDSREKLSTSKHVSSSMTKEHQYSPSEAEDVVKPTAVSHSAAVDLKRTPHPSYSSSLNDPSCLPYSLAFSSKKEAPIKDAEASSILADGYHDDFESSSDLSPRGEQHSSEPGSQISVSSTEMRGSRKDSPVRATPYDSQDEEVEEEIPEELSHISDASQPSNQTERLLDLHKQIETDSNDSKSIISNHSPPISALQTPLSPVTDDMPGFDIGDRVLVGGVQPGTLRFKGPTSFANGFWAGVELDKSEGSNNGTYDGVVYFECDEFHGIFAPPDKITHLPDKFEIYTDTTEDEDSFVDDLSDKIGDKPKTDKSKSRKQGNQNSINEQTSHKDFGSGEKMVTDDSVHKNQAPLNDGSDLSSNLHKEFKHSMSNGNSRYIVLDFGDAPATLLISDMDKIDLGKPSQKEITTLVEREDIDSQHQSTPAGFTTDIRDYKGDYKDTGLLDTFADELINNFVKDTVKQLAEIKKAKEQKIEAGNQMNGDLCGENVEEEWVSSVEQKDGLPFFLPTEKEELSSPELCNRPESPVLGASGQEELAKRLAELELSRELLDELGDDQDWFDEDFGLSSRREQQRLKQKQRELPLPLPPKLPEQPAMVVPHSAIEVEKMVHAATQEIWESCALGEEEAPPLSQLPNPTASQEYLGKEASGQDQEALSIRSYRKAVYDLTWEILQEIFAEDPNADQPQWVKPQQVKSSFFHRVKSTGNLTKIQEFITAEVLKLYGLAKDQSQKTDWQKMLKFGRKKRDRVDHILVQELHEEEAQWVNYNEDELLVKMQLADSIFDALLKDTANELTLIYDKRTGRMPDLIF
uniref:CAP-Gly domain-containing protein n=1 Tax=Monopterus albus TaxID=43700 RepID=A0A3Q3K3L2_MONAL